MSTLQKAKEIASRAHAGQFRWDGIIPYITHPEAVAKSVGTATVEEFQIVAWLHDVVEDSDWTIGKLRLEGFSHMILYAVDILTKEKTEPYDVYINRVRQGPYVARQVKIADIRHNLSTSTDKEAKNKRIIWRLSLLLLGEKLNG